jgi:valyl-tRNA synthetase
MTDEECLEETASEQGASGYDVASVEGRWQRMWEEESIYRFDPRSKKEPFTIDNPPRYASGPLHAGHVVHYTHIDFAARYKRMRGFNVMFPLCFDVNGMPIEVRVEKKYGIKMREYDRHEFIRLCEEFAEGNIGEMTRQFMIFGESMDRSVYYQTDAKYYRRLTQISFIRMFAEGRIFKANHPVNWCPRCGTALAESEVEYQENVTKLNTILFSVKGDPARKVRIATTRPELLCTCQLVAVHPEDTRYADLVGRTLLTPIFHREVPVIADPTVDREYGTGVVMICTIGDKEDLRWVFQYNLKLEKGIDEHGCMTDLAGPYKGMELKDARQKAISDLLAGGLLVDQKDNPQNVGTCWRCHTTIEFLQVPQWFIRILDMKDEVLAASESISWYPDFMKVRLREWVNSLSWDWVISRQRYFATPIPVWECVKCGHAVTAKESDCYVDPTLDRPPVDRCTECGGELKGSEEVFDTWMDSSISPLYNAFWLRDEALFKKLYPMSLRPQSHDIIRTWAFYSIVRGLKLAGQKPWNNIMMGGFIMAPDGTPMHASKGNAIDPLEYHAKYGADAIRYYAATCVLGKDHPFRIKDVQRGSQIARKFHNIQKLIGNALEGIDPKDLSGMKRRFSKGKGLHPIDLWVIHRLSEVIAESTEACDTYQFDKSVKSTVDFMWLEAADQYLEMAKNRLRERDPAAVYTFYTLGISLCKLLAPFLPFITEEAYQNNYRRIDRSRSVHISKWPVPILSDPEGAGRGALASEIVRSVRRYKAEKRISLGAPMGPIRLITDDFELIEGSLDDIKNTLKASEVTFGSGDDLRTEVIGLSPVFKELGPAFKDRVNAILKILKDPQSSAELALIMEMNGEVNFDPGDGRGEITLTTALARVITKLKFKGLVVNTIEVGPTIVIIEQ